MSIEFSDFASTRMEARLGRLLSSYREQFLILFCGYHLLFQALQSIVIHCL
jgi:hypothetical protein